MSDTSCVRAVVIYKLVIGVLMLWCCCPGTSAGSVDGDVSQCANIPEFPRFARSSEEKNARIVGVVGGSAELPCDVDVSTCGKIYFITWTKNVSNEWKRLYLYSEMVDKPLQELAYPDRADFILRESTAYLRIYPLRIEDDGTYKCDVTYVQGKCPSLSFATLTTHAQPSAPTIEKDGKMSPNGSVVGPFYEGATLTLECETFGGKPTPEVSWFKAGEELDSESHVRVEKSGASSVTSTVRVELERDDLAARIECHVDNEATEEPLVSWVEVDLHVGPSDLIIEGPTAPVLSGDLVTLTCTIEGAKPAANATWYNRSEVLSVSPMSRIELADDGTFRTISTVEVPVTRHDHLGTYYCKGINSVLQNKGEAPQLKSVEIHVLYPPAVVMQPSGGVIVNETDSATVYCTYEANPFNVSDVIWYHDDRRLAVPTEGKYEPGGQGYPTLTVRDVRKEDRGSYSCSLSNTVGRGNASNNAEINVLYPPVVQATISPDDVKEGSSISLFCDILEGNPQNLLKVRWFKGEELLHKTTEREIVWVGVSRNSSGLYTCEGENAAGWGDPSDVEELIVQYLPGPATLLELNETALKGKTSALQCVVDEPGLPPAAVFRWEQDGELLVTTSGENYTTKTHMVTSKGNYSCAAVNEVGVGPRGYHHLAVKAPPTFIRDLPDIRGAARDAPFISFECRVECDPLCDVYWTKDGGAPLSSSDLYIVRSRALPEDAAQNRFRSVSGTLQFNMTAWPGRRLERDRDRANYTCYSTPNEAGPGVFSTMTFLVEYPPESLTLSESEVQVLEGERFPSVECSASSWPPSTFLWLQGDAVLARDDTLSFNATVERHLDGLYTCEARNTHGKAQIEMKLTVLYKPECTISESSGESGEDLLVCRADASPSFINFTWIKDNETLDEDYEVSSEGSHSVYVLPADDRFGLYRCIAVNDVGDSTPCERFVSGPGLAGWHAEFGDKNVFVIAAVIGSIAILFVLAIIIIIIIMRRRRTRTFGSPGKVPLGGGGGDGLYQNVSGRAADPKQNGPPLSDTEGNVMYENMPFHRQGPIPSFPSARTRQSLPADFSRAYQNVLYFGPAKHQQQSQQQQQQWTTADQQPPQLGRRTSSKQQREPCPQHGSVVEPPGGRENGELQNCAHPSALVYADLALPRQRNPPLSKRATEYATLHFAQEAGAALPPGQQ